ncbi:EF-P lysine aminoacylase GenX [Candidatus Woesebacteria bacterium]|nr:EF-P lysine aminoacylase GenX [Candidatus Woesebacteria bacterium]
MKQWQKLKTEKQVVSNHLMREAVIDGIRIYFKTHGFHEVETPLFVASPDPEPTIELFKTVHKAHNYAVTGYLTGSPEFMMKKLLAAGSGNIFQVCKSFRNGEPVSSRHNPEFTILEWYRTESDYRDVMADCEGLFRFLLSYTKAIASGELKNPYEIEAITSNNKILSFRGKTFDLSAEWERLSVPEAFLKYSGISIDELLSEELLLKKAKEKGYSVDESTTYDDAFYQIMLNEIEPHLGEVVPTFLYDYPASQAALSKKKESDPRLAERFELYIDGLELGNAFSELADWKEQQSRFENQLAVRTANGQDSWGIDTDFIAALQGGFPRCGGIAVGVDRLVMLFANVSEIAETLYFPANEVFELDE